MKLRAGRQVGRTLYDVDSDALVGVVDTPELAAAIVSAVNERDELREVMAALLDYEADTAEEVHAYQAVLRRAEKLLGRTR